MFARQFFVIFSFIFVVLMTIACKKEQVDNANNKINTANVQRRVNITGEVVDLSGKGIANVLVASEIESNITSLTDGTGKFIISNVPVVNDKYQLTLRKDSYAPLQVGKKITKSEKQFIKVALTTQSRIGEFDANTGGTFFVSGGGKILIPPKSLVNKDGTTVSGRYELYLTHYDANSDNIELAMPGTDLSGITLSGQNVQLETFGAYKVDLQSKSNKTTEENLFVKPNTIQVCLPIPNQLLSKAPNTVPIWVLNSGQWVEIGEASRNGNQYCGYVDQSFRACNFDRFYIPAIIEGSVCNNDHTPAQGILIKVGTRHTLTDAQGNYEIALEPNIPFTINTPFGDIAYSSGLNPENGTIFRADAINCSINQDSTDINDSTIYVLNHSINNGKITLSFQTTDNSKEFRSLTILLSEATLDKSVIDVTDYQEFQSKNYEGKAIGQLISKQGITWHSKNKKSDGKADQMAGSIFIEQRVNNLPQGKFSIRFRKQNSLEERTVSARFIVK